MDLQHLFHSPDQFLFGFEGPDAVFIDMDRDAYGRSTFLDQRITAKSSKTSRIPRAQLHAWAGQATWSQPNYIFHIAHCGSTLLAKALDLKDANLVLREPAALRQLGRAVGEHLFGAPLPEPWLRDVSAASALFGRRYLQNAPVIVKANVPVNFMIAPLLELGGSQPAVALHYSMENYLLAILRSEMHCGWILHVSNQLQRGLDMLVGAAPPNVNIGVMAARLWLAQILLFRDALARFPNLVSLDADYFFDNAAESVASVFRHFRQPQSQEVIDSIVQSELFARHSKDPRHKFDNGRRIAQREQLRRALGAQLQAARSWIEPLARRLELPARLDRPLVGRGSDLL